MSRWFKLGDRRGNVALIAALCAPIMMLMVGAAIDYGYALNINQRLNEAADTAVLSAISPSIAQGAGTYAAAYPNAMTNVLNQTFTTNTVALPVKPTWVPSVSSSITNTNITTYTATLTYSASVPTIFSGLVGLSTISISGHAQATTTPLTYIRYYILIDNSQSMGIGATSTDMQNLYTRIANNGQGTGGEKGCVFGCHVAESTQAHSNEEYAHNLVSYSTTGSYSTTTGYVDTGGYITLRIDSANTAVDTMIQKAIAAENSTSPNISIGLYTMSSYPSASVTQIFAPTTNLSPYKNVAVDLGPNISSGLGDSDLPDQLTYFAKNILPTQQGTGASASSPLNYVFIITDGLTDIYDASGTCTYDHCIGPLPSSYCNQLKNVATVGVIYTTYNTIASDPYFPTSPNCSPLECTYQLLVYPTVSPTDMITSNLKACATTPSLFFPASDGPTLVTALQSLFATSLQSVRLTQ